MPEMRADYLTMLSFGLEYLVQHGGSAAGLRGCKYLVLAKAVTVGRLRKECSRGVKETRGRIRLVLAGHLEQLVVELFADAEAFEVEAEAEAAAALAAADATAAEAQTDAAQHGRRVRAEAIAAAASLGRTCAPPGHAATMEGAGSSAEAAGRPVAATEAELAPGCSVRLRDLACVELLPLPVGVLESGGVEPVASWELNGLEGTLVRWVAERGRWAVRVNGVAGLVAARAVNLSMIRAAPLLQPAPEQEAVELGNTLDVEKKLATVLRYCAAGYLSKGYAQFGASPLADPRLAAVRARLRALHPQPGDASAGALPPTPTVPTAAELCDKPGVQAHVSTFASFCEVFSKPPQERGVSVDEVSYEDLQQLYHSGERAKRTLYNLVCLINAGQLDPAVADVLGESLLVGLRKPDGGTRPIGIGAALRRLAGRVLMADEGEEMGKVFTTTRVPAELLEKAGFARDHPCNTPMQLGVNVVGGAEIAVGIVRAGLQLKPSWAVFSEDKVNGFNAVSRRAIYAGLWRWFPWLIPAFRQWYSRQGRLYTCLPGRRGRGVLLVGGVHPVGLTQDFFLPPL